MPKKFAGENSKAVAAKERKAAAKEQQTNKKKQQAEEEYWKDDNKHIAKKQQRKEDQDRKKEETASRKAEAKALLEKEMVAVSKPPKTAPAPRKVTRAEITQNAKPNQAPVKKEKVETHLETPLEENLNRVTIDGEEARNITDAITLLNGQGHETDKHPEKRMKAAYSAFEERRLQVLKEENPGLRLSQLKQMIFKEWQKSAENPLVNPAN